VGTRSVGFRPESPLRGTPTSRAMWCFFPWGWLNHPENLASETIPSRDRAVGWASSLSRRALPTRFAVPFVSLECAFRVVGPFLVSSFGRFRGCLLAYPRFEVGWFGRGDRRLCATNITQGRSGVFVSPSEIDRKMHASPGGDDVAQ
jgi:hypothetical protein